MCIVGKIEIFIYEFGSHFLSPFTLLPQRPSPTLFCFMMKDFLTNFPLTELQSEKIFSALGILTYGVRFYHKSIIELCAYVHPCLLRKQIQRARLRWMRVK